MDLSEILPLKIAWFHILLALADGAQHGFGIRERVKVETDDSVKLWPATLYGSLRDLADLGAIDALEGDEDPDEDQRRRYYRLTPLGRDLLRAEADRMEALVEAARTSKALG
jgi:DNA-binding PadR family transcriptional regulator